MGSESPVAELYDSNGNPLSVQNAVAIPASTPGLISMGSDGTNSRYILVDGSGRQLAVGAGTAGTPTGGVITIQGDPSGTPIPITGSISATNPSVGVNDTTLPGSSTLISGSDGTNLRPVRIFDLDSGGGTQWVLGVGLRKSAGGGSVEFGTTSDPIRIDPTGTTTQPVSGTVTANQGGSWTVSGTGNFTVVQSTASNLRAQLASETTTGTAVPSTALQVGGSDGTNLRPIFLDSSGRQIIIGAAANGAAVVGAPVLVAGSDGTNARSIRTATDGTVRIDPTGTTTQPVSGTVTANIGTTNGLALDATLAKLTIAQSTALGSNTQALVGGSVTTAAPTYTTGQINPLSLTTAGALRIDGSGVTQPVSGTVTANQGTANTLANAWPVKVTDGTNSMPTGDAVGRAIFEKITDGTNTAAVKAASTAPAATDPSLVVSLSPNNSLFAFGGDQRLRVGQETMMFFDGIDGTTIDLNRWIQSQSGMTQAQSAGSLTLNSGSSLTSGNYSILTSNRQFVILVQFPICVQFRARLIPQTNAVIELGFGNVATTATPTDGIFIRIDSTGNLRGVINNNGTETTTAVLGTLTSANYYNFEITIDEDGAKFLIISPDGTTTNISSTLPISATSGSPASTNHLPIYARVYNSSATSSAAQILISSTNVQQLDLNNNKTWPDQVASTARSAIFDPSTFAQSATYTNNTVPASATLSNTAAGYTTLGGLYKFAAVAGAETDYALFAYQVPTGYTLYVKSIYITAFITGAQSSTNPTLMQWAVATGSSAVSLATGAPNPPIFLPIGMQTSPKTASVADSFTPGFINFTPQTPIVTNSGKFFHIVLRMPVSNATASQIIRGTVTVEGYFE